MSNQPSSSSSSRHKMRKVVVLVLCIFSLWHVSMITVVEGQLQKWNMANFSSTSTGGMIEFLGDAEIYNTTGPPILAFDLDGFNRGVPTSGRAWYSKPVQFLSESTGMVASFKTNFTFQINNNGGAGEGSPNGCSGFTFQVSADNTSVGDTGEYLGLTTAASNGAVNEVFAVEFDTFRNLDLNDPSSSHLGVDLNSVKSVATLDLCPNLTSCTNLTNNLFLAQIAFQGAQQSLSVQLYLNATTLVANWTVPNLSILPILKPYMFVGFSASSGVNCSQTHNIYSWGFTSSRSTAGPPIGTPNTHVTYNCYSPGGCSSHRNLIIGLIVGVGSVGIILALLFVFLYCCRKKEDYSAVVTESKSAPNSANGEELKNLPIKADIGEKADHKGISAGPDPGPITYVQPSAPAKAERGKKVTEPKAGVAQSVPLEVASNQSEKKIGDHGKVILASNQVLNQNGDAGGKVSLCCVPTKPQRDYKVEPVVFTYKELEQATKKFSEKELLGGTPGRKAVYKGLLRDTGTMVAIKEFSQESLSNDFLSKALLVGRIRHPNLVSFYGWCQEKPGKLYLVYEYISTGSLEKVLHLEPDAKNFMGFDLRVNVLLGVATGLTYLHEGWEQCVVHRDVKPSNVLLDESLNAHLGNFSHASLVDHDKEAASTVLDGTLGYMAPEIPFTGKPTPKSDVFSFGVLILEMVCGRLPLVWSLPHQERVLLDCVWTAHENRDLLRMVDKRFGDSYSLKQMTTLLELGLYCCQPDPSTRPTMPFVWQILVGGAKVPELPKKKPEVRSYNSAAPGHHAVGSLS